MGTETRFKKVKLFAGFIYKDLRVCEEIKAEMESRFSTIDLQSEQFIFDKTTYYDPEMGTPLYKQLVSFSKLIEPEQLPEIKIYTNGIEVERADSGNRTINIDPGFLSDANVILATTKNHYHRVPLTKGIYAHIEYVIKKRNTLTPMEWTYPDFRTQQYKDWFVQLIATYKQDIKMQKTAEKKQKGEN
jgi:Domain of unknown function (DUF4416)